MMKGKKVVVKGSHLAWPKPPISVPQCVVVILTDSLL